MTAQCQVWLDSCHDVYCSNVAVADITAGCVHEHIETASICVFHLEMHKRHEIVCSVCTVSTSPHECEQRLITISEFADD